VLAGGLFCAHLLVLTLVLVRLALGPVSVPTSDSR
jgi:hypothetical protein